jgi:hypothetical protein
VDVLLLAVLDQVVALQHGVAFDLVGSGNDAGAIDEGLKLFIQSLLVRLRDIHSMRKGNERAQ